MNFFKHIKRNVAGAIVMTCLFISQTTFAAGFGDSKYAKGTVALVNDIFSWLTMLLIPATAGLMIAYQAWRKKVADGDGATITEANKAMKRILIAAVIGETASTLVTLVTGYYR